MDQLSNPSSQIFWARAASNLLLMAVLSTVIFGLMRTSDEKELGFRLNAALISFETCVLFSLIVCISIGNWDHLEFVVLLGLPCIAVQYFRYRYGWFNFLED